VPAQQCRQKKTMCWNPLTDRGLHRGNSSRRPTPKSGRRQHRRATMHHSPITAAPAVPSGGGVRSIRRRS